MTHLSEIAKPSQHKNVVVLIEELTSLNQSELIEEIVVCIRRNNGEYSFRKINANSLDMIGLLELVKADIISNYRSEF